MSSRMLVPWLSLTLLVSWGSLYYAFAVLAKPMQLALGCDLDTLTGAFSLSLLVWGLATYPVGLALQRWGGRVVMTAGSTLAAVSFAALRDAASVRDFYLVWIALGVAMSMTLYVPAFAVIVQSHRANHRRQIGWLTIFGDLASTVFWPLTHQISSSIGWRGATAVFAALPLLICMPVHILLPAKVRGSWLYFRVPAANVEAR